MEMRLVGTTTGWFDLVQRPVLAGRVFLSQDVDNTAPVCVLTEYGARRLLATGNTVVAKPSELTPMTAHMLAEYTYGSGRGVRRFMCMAIGTGLGAGVMLNGQPVRLIGGKPGDLLNVGNCRQGGCGHGIGQAYELNARANCQTGCAGKIG